jgi:hypothetical protein
MFCDVGGGIPAGDPDQQLRRGTELPGKLGSAEGRRQIGNEEEQEGNQDHNHTANGDAFPEI